MNKSRPIFKAAGLFFDLFRGSTFLMLIWLVLLSLAFYPGHCWAQNNIRIAGYVYDEVSGHPIPLAMVQVVDTDLKKVTDHSGYFHFENLPEDIYALSVTAEGYLSDIIDNIRVYPALTTTASIQLARKIFYLEDHNVSEQLQRRSSGGRQVIDKAFIQQGNFHSLSDVLNMSEGVYVQDTGPEGGRSVVSIRGCDPEQVLVLIDGRRINSAADGVVDLNSIPLEMIERIEIYRGGQSARFGPDALGGAINIITRSNIRGEEAELSSTKFWGKWKTAQYSLILRDFIPAENVISGFAYGFHGTSGDFNYSYSIAPRPDMIRKYSGSRLNAYSHHRNYFWTISRSCGNNFSVGTGGQVFRSENGLPGRVSAPDTTAHAEDDRIFISAQGNYRFNYSSFVELLIGFSRLRQYHANLENPREAEKYESRYINDIYSLQLKTGSSLWQGNHWLAGFDLQRDVLYHDDFYRPVISMGRTVRDNAGIYVNDNIEISPAWLPFWDIVAFDLAARYDNTETRKDSTSWQDISRSSRHDNFSYKTGFSLATGGRIRLIVRGTYGRSYRLPLINSLFWKGDARSRGNPGLKPEKSEHSDIGIEAELNWWARLSCGMTYFHSFVHDLIEWQPGYQGVWYPINLDGARLSGHEEFVRVTLWNDRIRFDYQNTITVAKNRTPTSSSFNKILAYRPHYVTRFNLALRIWKFQGQYSIRSVGRRYSLEANTKWYDEYRVDDTDFGFEIESRRLTFAAQYQVKNLNAERYVIIGQYPMPGRGWGCELSLGYSF